MTVETGGSNHVVSKTAARPAIMEHNGQPRAAEGPSGMVVKREVVARIPTPEGVFSLALYSNNKDDKEHLAIIFGPISALSRETGDVYVRVHSECFTGV